MAELQYMVVTEGGDFVVMNETNGEMQQWCVTEGGDFYVYDNTLTATGGGGGGGATFIQMIIISG